MIRRETRTDRDLAWKHQELARVVQAFKRTYATDEGRIALNYVIHGLCKTDSRTNVTHDTHQTYLNLGKRDVGLAVLELINTEADAQSIIEVKT